MNNTARLTWSTFAKRLPDSINAQLVGTFPSIVEEPDGTKVCAFYVRATSEEFGKARKTGSTSCLVKPQFVKTPQGPLIVVYCMVDSTGSGFDPFFSETAIFPRLPSLPIHREIADMLLSKGEVYYIVSNESGECIFNSKARVMNEWRAELAEKEKAFDEGKQITDEKSAIMSLYWYQERYNPTDKIFEVRH